MHAGPIYTLPVICGYVAEEEVLGQGSAGGHYNKDLLMWAKVRSGWVEPDRPDRLSRGVSSTATAAEAWWRAAAPSRRGSARPRAPRCRPGSPDRHERW